MKELINANAKQHKQIRWASYIMAEFAFFFFVILIWNLQAEKEEKRVWIRQCLTVLIAIHEWDVWNSNMGLTYW